MKMNLRTELGWLVRAACLAALVGGTSAQADPLNLPPASCGIDSSNNCLVFDDFTVYSLGLLQDQQDAGQWAGFNFLAKPNEAQLFVLSGQGTPLQGNGTNIDDPYDAFQGDSTTQEDNLRYLFASQSLQSGGDSNDIPSDPAGTGTWDNTQANRSNVLNSDTFTSEFDASKFSNPACQADINTDGCMPLWDAQIADVLDALGNSNLTFLFQFDETGDSGVLEGQDLQVWARVTLSNPTTGESEDFTFSGNNVLFPAAQSDPQVAGVNDILPAQSDLWAHVHSEICVQDSTGDVFLGECQFSPFASGDRHTVNQSLGADQAGFAAISDSLNTALRSGDYTIMTVDLRMAWLNNGPEQLWIVGTCPPDSTSCVVPPPPVPEPGTLALLALGLLGLARYAKSRKGGR